MIRAMAWVVMVGLVLLAQLCAIRFWRVDRFLVYAAAHTFLALAASMFGLGAWNSVMFLALAAFYLWLWWKQRKRKTPSRVLGVVMNVGHRLRVINIPGQGPSPITSS